MLRLKLALLIATLWITSAAAQPSPDTLWTMLLNVSLDERGMCVEEAPIGGYVVAGSFLLGEFYQYVLLKVNAIGLVSWIEFFGGEDDDEGRYLCVTADSGYAIVGRSQSFGSGSSDIWLVRTNRFGDSLWTHAYGGNRIESPYYLEETADRGFMIAGWTNAFTQGEHDFHLVRTDRHGNQRWEARYGTAFNDEAFTAQETADSGFVLAGFSESPDSPYPTQLYIVRTDSVGDTLWTGRYGGAGSDESAQCIRQTADGGFVAAGYTIESIGLPADMYVVRTNGAGDTLWTRTIGGAGDQRAYSVRQTRDGGFILTGYSIPYGQNHRDIYLVKTDSLGQVQWTRRWDRGHDRDEAFAVRTTADGGYVLCGTTCPRPGDGDIYVVKTGPDSLFLAADDPGFVPQPASLSLACYPNPFNAQATLAFELSTRTDATLILYDLLGGVVRALHRGPLDPGAYTFSVPAGDLASGTYFARLVTPRGSVTRKLLLVR